MPTTQKRNVYDHIKFTRQCGPKAFSRGTATYVLTPGVPAKVGSEPGDDIPAALADDLVAGGVAVRCTASGEEPKTEAAAHRVSEPDREPEALAEELNVTPPVEGDKQEG